MRKWVFLSGLVLAAGCSGGDSGSRYEDLRAQAEAKEQLARQLGVDSPCTASEQCGALVFESFRDECWGLVSQTYSLVSDTASQAVAAADEQQRLAQEAIQAGEEEAQARGAPPVCVTASLTLAPRYACVSNRCVVGEAFSD